MGHNEQVSDLIDTTEMYLRTIYELVEEGIVPLRARIAERLHQSGPTVSQTVARMERDGLVTVEGDRHLQLTEQGLDLATRRGRVRPLPPLPRGRRPHGAPRTRGLPLLGVLVAGAADRVRRRQRRGARVLRPAGRRAARPRRGTDGDALPLGPPAGPRDGVECRRGRR